MTTSFHDLEILSRTLWGEARGEPFVGKTAIVHVIRNRLKRAPRYGNTIAEVCLKPWQFSAWNAGAYRAAVEAATIEQMSECIQAAAKGLVEDDFTHNSTHYFADTIATPKWARGLTPALIVGHHRFFAGVD